MSMKEVNQDGTLVPVTQKLPGDLFVEFERRDNDAIMAELQGAVIEEFVYSFNQNGKRIVGMSLPGVMAVAQQMGGITCGQPIWTITDEDITCDISATDHKVGLTVWGTATAPLMFRDKSGNDRRDTFARAKALSKAQRNAIRKVIPETVATEMLKQFMRGESPQQPQQYQPSRQQQQRQPPPQVQEVQRPAVEIVDEDGVIVELQSQPMTAENTFTATEKQQKAIFAIGRANGWTDDEIHDVLVEEYHKESTKELTVREASAFIDLLKSGNRQQPELING